MLDDAHHQPLAQSAAAIRFQYEYIAEICESGEIADHPGETHLRSAVFINSKTEGVLNRPRHDLSGNAFRPIAVRQEIVDQVQVETRAFATDTELAAPKLFACIRPWRVGHLHILDWTVQRLKGSQHRLPLRKHAAHDLPITILPYPCIHVDTLTAVVFPIFRGRLRIFPGDRGNIAVKIYLQIAELDRLVFLPSGSHQVNPFCLARSHPSTVLRAGVGFRGYLDVVVGHQPGHSCSVPVSGGLGPCMFGGEDFSSGAIRRGDGPPRQNAICNNSTQEQNQGQNNNDTGDIHLDPPAESLTLYADRA